MTLWLHLILKKVHEIQKVVRCSTLRKITVQENHTREVAEEVSQRDAPAQLQHLKLGVFYCQGLLCISSSAMATWELWNYLTFRVQRKDASPLRSQLGKALLICILSVNKVFLRTRGIFVTISTISLVEISRSCLKIRTLSRVKN